MANNEKEKYAVSEEDLIQVAGGEGTCICAKCGARFGSEDEVRAHWATCTPDSSWRVREHGSAPKNKPSPEMEEVLKKMHEVAARNGRG